MMQVTPRPQMGSYDVDLTPGPQMTQRTRITPGPQMAQKTQITPGPQMAQRTRWTAL